MPSKNKPDKVLGTTSTAPDAGSQDFINKQRALAEQSAAAAQSGNFFTGPLEQTPGEMAQAFMNPYQDQVIGGIRSGFDHLRGQASNQTNSDAQMAGAFGGSRQGALEGARLGALDRSQMQQEGQFLNQGYQNALGQGTQFAEHQRQLQQQQMQAPLFGNQQAMNMMNLGMGPVGQTSTQTQPGGSRFGGALGGAASGFAAGGPVGALAGGLFGAFG
jgi:hypothetical protein